MHVLLACTLAANAMLRTHTGTKLSRNLPLLPLAPHPLSHSSGPPLEDPFFCYWFAHPEYVGEGLLRIHATTRPTTHRRASIGAPRIGGAGQRPLHSPLEACPFDIG